MMLRLQLALLGLTSSLGAYMNDGLHRLRNDEDGLTTSELTILTVMLAGAAMVVAGIIYVAAKSSAEAIPVPEAPAP